MKLTMANDPIETNGQPPVVGAALPDFKVTKADGATAKMSDLITRPTMISVVPNINTSVCSISTKRFNSEVDNYDGVNFYTISTNTTDEQKNWCAAEGVEKMELLSDKEHNFGDAMGLFVEAAGLDARSIWIIDAEGKIVYQELISELTNEPNYDAALDFLAKMDK